MKNETLPVQDFSAHTPMMQQYSTSGNSAIRQ